MSDLNERETEKLIAIKKVLVGEYTKKEASSYLGLTIRQIDRLLNKLKEEGEKGFVHKNRGKESKRKISDKIKKEVVDLYITEYFDYNFTHFFEEIQEKYNLSYKTIDNILTETDIISPEAQHKTIKLYNTNMKKAIRQKKATENQVEILKKRQETERQKHIRRSSLLYNYGQEIQMDAAFAIWYGKKARALHLAVDKATKQVLYGWFDIQETTRAYFVMLMNIILKHGIPKKIKTDKRGTFSINNVKSKSSLNTTQFGRICEELEIYLSSSSDPLFKPNVERENKTFKGRLIAELRHENIVNDESANKYLNEVFIPKMNSKFAYEIDFERNDMRENTYDFEELNIIISERYSRKIDNSSSIKYKSKYYIPVDIETGEIMSFEQNTVGIIIIAYDNSYWCNIDETIYKLHEIQATEKKIYQKTTKTQEEINKSKAHKPALNHPWRNYRKS
jgi:transposase